MLDRGELGLGENLEMIVLYFIKLPYVDRTKSEALELWKGNLRGLGRLSDRFRDGEFGKVGTMPEE